MTKGQLIQTLTNRFGITKNESTRIVHAVFGSMTDALAKGDRFEFRGLATFNLKE